MSKLNKPKFLVKDILLDISDTIRDPQKRNDINHAISFISSQSNLYDKLASEHKLHNIKPSSVTGTSLNANEMKKLYDEKIAKGKLKTKYYDKLITQAQDGICPICGVGHVSNLDHYLPKSSYPIYAITPTNLVPVCRDCNVEKLDSTFTSYCDSPFHPYYDDMDDMVWLKAEIRKQTGGNIVVKYFVNPDIETNNPSLYTKFVNHCKMYKLFDLFSLQAAGEISDNLLWRKKILVSGGEKEIVKIFKDMLMSYERFHINTWKTALFRALIDDALIIFYAK